MPGSDYLSILASVLRDKISDGDIIVVSEKALAVAKGLIIDEKEVKPGLLAKILACFWMRIVWGFFLGKICHLKRENIQRLRRYPKEESTAAIFRSPMSAYHLMIRRASLKKSEFT